MKRVRKNGISWFLDEHEGLEAVVEGVVEEAAQDGLELGEVLDRVLALPQGALPLLHRDVLVAHVGGQDWFHRFSRGRGSGVRDRG